MVKNFRKFRNWEINIQIWCNIKPSKSKMVWKKSVRTFWAKKNRRNSWIFVPQQLKTVSGVPDLVLKTKNFTDCAILEEDKDFQRFSKFFKNLRTPVECLGVLFLDEMFGVKLGEELCEWECHLHMGWGLWGEVCHWQSGCHSHLPSIPHPQVHD